MDQIRPEVEDYLADGNKIGNRDSAFGIEEKGQAGKTVEMFGIKVFFGGFRGKDMGGDALGMQVGHQTLQSEGDTVYLGKERICKQRDFQSVSLLQCVSVKSFSPLKRSQEM
jgi:hypothetical protein